MDGTKWVNAKVIIKDPQPAITCLTLTIKTLEKGVKYVHS